MTKTMYKTVLSVMSKSFVMLVLLLSLVGVQESRASHATGADLTYQSLGNGQYLVTFSFYRDCFGIDAPLTQNLNVLSATCNFSQSYTMDQIPGTGQEITHPCSTATSTCAGGSVTGIQLWQYQVVVTLPAQCIDWQFNTSVSSRNAAVTTIVNPDFNDLFVDAFLNNTISDNNSPYFTNDPIAFVCINQTNIFNHGIIDPDGDSLVYSFIAPRSDPNTPLQYAPGYSVQDPFTSNPPVSIDPVTGNIICNPTTQEVASVALLVQEYRNGVLIGTVMRDMQIYIVNCNNSLPNVTGIDSTQNIATSTCAGTPICFEVFANDSNAADTLIMDWNQGIPQGTFTVTGTPQHPVGTFCWTPTAADARPQPYTFIVIVRDNACPSNGVATGSFNITVSDMNIQVTSSPSVQCPGSHTGTASATASAAIPPLQYAWTLPGGTVLTTPSVSHLGGGSYTLNITDSTGCIGTETFTIAEPPPINIALSPINAGCGGALGSLIANVTGGTPDANGNYNYSWNTSPVQHNDTATNLQTGTYTVNVTDDNGCTSSSSAPVVAVTGVNFSIGSTPATCLANDGSVTVTHTGGVGPYSYHWSNTTDSTISSQNGLITGSYSVVATDLGTGCTESLSTIVQNAAGISASITSQTDASCSTAEDGSATVAASGGQPGYTYLWPNNDTTASTNHLAVGTHLVMVEDYNGCRAYAAVTIGFTNPAPAVDLGPDTMPCIGTPFTMDAGPGGSYLWSDNSTSQTLTVSSSGTYSVVVTGGNGCQSFDAVNVTFVVCMAGGGPSSHSVAPTQIQGKNIYIYPNPATNNISVTVQNVEKTDISVSLTDILGNDVYYSNDYALYGYSKQINIEELPAGVYLVKVQYNGETSTARIVKQ